MTRRNRGFSLIEILLALAIIGIIAGIAIPSFLGSRAQARYIGDARANTEVIRQNLENFRADNGQYPAGTYVWTKGAPPDPNPLPNVAFKDSTKLDFTVTVNDDRLTYTISSTDPSQGNKQIYKVDQTGQIVP
jgi:prepilin-type N-terminal cleavage/methylation domain-containing protein